MVAGPTMVYKLNESVKQVSYLWTIKPIPNQKDKSCKIQKFFTNCQDISIPNGPEVEKGRIFLTYILDRIGLSRGAQQLFINGYRFETQRHYLYAIRTLAEFSYEHGLMNFQKLQATTIYMLRMLGLMISRLCSSEVTANALPLKPSRNKEVEKLNEVTQLHCQNIIYNTLVIVRCYGIQLLNNLCSRSMRPYPSVEELNQATAQGYEAI
ncbi:MAG: hypothetical protein EZS28_001032 [Streblomastix strix]|uniref:Uncharacterized protein n=1 Tax=Streblomastix strix TaxID=222440 RepID=A0A5J4X854_9EUKA|nr:MAG: hypothetical protein EZS28_001032 [Streblomastix strix]